jgi:hypothetical protein
MASMGEGENLIDHGLHSDFYGLHPIFLEQGESLFIQGVGPCGDANGIDQTGSEERLDFFEIANLIIPMDRREAPPVKGNLFFPGFLVVRNLDQRGFNKVTNGRGRGGAFKRCLLIAEETAVAATYRGKKNGND